MSGEAPPRHLEDGDVVVEVPDLVHVRGNRAPDTPFRGLRGQDGLTAPPAYHGHLIALRFLIAPEEQHCRRSVSRDVRSGRVHDAGEVDSSQDMLDDYVYHNAMALDELKKQGTLLKRFPDDVLAAMQRESAVVLGELAAQSELNGRIWASMQAFQAQVSQMHKVSEQELYNWR